MERIWHDCLPQQGSGSVALAWVGIGHDAPAPHQGRCKAASPKRRLSGPGCAARESALATPGLPSLIRSHHPLKAAHTDAEAHDQRRRGRVLGLPRSLTSHGPSLQRHHRHHRRPAKACRARARSLFVASSSIRCRRTGDRHRELHPREWALHGHETRFAQTATGAARLLGTNYRRGMQSRCNRAHPPRLTRRAPTLVCHPLGNSSRGDRHGHQKHPQPPHRKTLPHVIAFDGRLRCRRPLLGAFVAVRGCLGRAPRQERPALRIAMLCTARSRLIMQEQNRE